VTGTLQGLTVHTGLSNRYLAGPHGSYKSQWQVPWRAPWLVQVSMTGTLQGLMVCTSFSDRYLAGPMVHTGLSDRYLEGPQGSYRSQ